MVHMTYGKAMGPGSRLCQQESKQRHRVSATRNANEDRGVGVCEPRGGQA
jgi:hypothetical protein